MKNRFRRIPLAGVAPPHLRFSIAMVALLVLWFSLLRFAFWIFFKDASDAVPMPLLLQSFYLGLKFDLRLALAVLLPVIVFGALSPVHLFHSRFGRLLWHSYLTLGAALILLTYLFDFGHFSYLHTRLNAAAVALLEDTAISIQMLWETYPILRVLFVFLFVTTLFYFVIGNFIRRFTPPIPIPPADAALAGYVVPAGRVQTAIPIALSILLVVLGLYGKISYYPLRWSDAFYSTNAFASAIALNPVLYLIDTFRAGSGKPYDEKIVREHYDEMAAYLGVPKENRKPLNFTRGAVPPAVLPLPLVAGTANTVAVSPAPTGLALPPPPVWGAPNIVLVQLESFSYHKTGLYGSDLNATPYFNDLSKKGIFFDNFFTPHEGTARAVFATVTGIPDVETHNTSTRNPMIICQHTIMNAFTKYEKFYFLGGSASWGNIRGLLSHNIPGLHIYEEGNFKSPRVDVWGISDLALFEEANAILRQKKDKPFFAYIQTAGNHRPYTIPEDHRGFQRLSPDPAALEKIGHQSVEEFNAFRFLDHSIGLFIEMAKKEHYFDNTIFVFFGDHGLTPGKGDKTPKWHTDLHLNGLHVPFLIYAPKFIPEGMTDSKIASQTDILPTLAGLAQVEYKNTTMGRDLLDPQFDNQRYAYTILHGAMPQIGLLADPYYFRMNDQGANKRLHRRDSASPSENLIAQFPKEAARLERQLRAMHETSKYMLYHNDSCG